MAREFKKIIAKARGDDKTQTELKKTKEMTNITVLCDSELHKIYKEIGQRNATFRDWILDAIHQKMLCDIQKMSEFEQHYYQRRLKEVDRNIS